MNRRGAAALAVALAMVATAPVAVAQQDVTDPGSTIPQDAPPPLVEASIRASTVRLRDGRLERDLQVVAPGAADGSARVTWEAFAGARSSRRLARVGHGVATVPVTDGVMHFRRRVAAGSGADRSGGFCEQIDLSSVGAALPDAAPCPDAATVRRADVPARVPEIVVFGDSVGATFEWVPGTKEAAGAGLSVEWDLRSCRRLEATPCPPNPPSVLQDVHSLAGSLGDIAVVNVGYNDWEATYDADAVYRALRARGVDHVVWVLLKPVQSSYRGINRIIMRLAHRHPDTVSVADWGRYVQAHGDWFGPDHIHPNAAGGWALARFLRREMRKAVAAWER